MATKLKSTWLNQIICPNCGKCYSPQEIFLAKHLFDEDNSETFQCEECDHNLHIELDIKYRVNLREESDEETEIVLDTTLYNPEIELEEK